MKPYFKYHPESGTILSRIVVVDDADLSEHAQDGYSFISAPEGDTTLEFWVDPLTKELHKTINYSLPERRMTVVGEEYVAVLPKPCWVQVAGQLPQKIEDGTYEIPFTDVRQSFRLVGQYMSNICFVFWRTLEEVQQNAKDKIDVAAEEARANLQTPGSGQAMTYLRKADAARALLSGFPISEAQRARLQDEADRSGIAIEEAAEKIVRNADEWEARDALIDSIRLASKDAVESASTGKEILDILDNLEWPK